MARKRIIVLESENLLSASTSSLLSSNEHLNVICMAFDKENLSEVIERFQPEVIVVDESLMDQHRDDYVKAIRCYPRLRTIVLSLGGNHVHVWDKELVHVTKLKDFWDQI